MSNYTFAMANDSDTPEILALYHSLIGTPGCTWHLAYPNQEIIESDIKNKLHYILNDRDAIIAVAAAGADDELAHLQWTPKNLCELARLGVIWAMQRQGIGTILLQNVIEAVKERGFDGIRMLVSKINFPALALYEKNGFTRCGETTMYGLDFYCYQMAFAPA